MGLFDEANKKAILVWLDQSPGKLFIEWAEQQLDHSLRTLEKADEATEMFRSQGEVKTWRRIVGLRHELTLPSTNKKEA